jgi:methionyl-tRNA formyltransferase
MGTPQFSAPILDALVENGYDVVAVVTQPDRPVGRKRVLTPPPVKVAALKHDLLVLQPEKISGSPEMETILSLEPDIIVTAAFGQFLPTKLLEAPKHGAINVHASLLPKYRGGAPVHYSIINHDAKTGVTIMEMVKKMDAGDMVAQRAIPIGSDDNVGTMFDKLSDLGRDMLIDTLPKYLAKEITPVPQKETEVTFSPNISREQEEVSWAKTAELVDAQVRGMYPFPIAFTTYEGNRWKLLHTTPVANESTTASPGEIIQRTKKQLWVAAGNGTVLQIDELQPAGKGKLSIVDFLNGAGSHVKVGDKLGADHE